MLSFVVVSPDNIDVLLQRSYIVYPPEGKKPPTVEELANIIEKEAKKRR